MSEANIDRVREDLAVMNTRSAISDRANAT